MAWTVSICSRWEFGLVEVNCSRERWRLLSVGSHVSSLLFSVRRHGIECSGLGNHGATRPRWICRRRGEDTEEGAECSWRRLCKHWATAQTEAPYLYLSGRRRMRCRNCARRLAIDWPTLAKRAHPCPTRLSSRVYVRAWPVMSCTLACLSLLGSLILVLSTVNGRS